MPFPKGHKKIGGRTAGTPNKSTVLKRTIQEMIDDGGMDPIAELVKLFAGATDFNEKFAVLKELAPYVHPKKSAVQMTADIDMRLIERVKELEALPDEELKKLAGK